jgi:pilus assembly protein CpaB
MGRRSVLLFAALVVAALGTTLVFLYVNGVNDKALAKQNPTRVLVAQKLITAGTSVQDATSAGSFNRKIISSDDAIPGAISAIAPINGMTANTNIYPGDQITPEKFSTAATTGKVPVVANRLAVSVALNDPAQVVGFVTPGSRVAIFLTTTTGKNGAATQVLLPEVKVLAVGTTTAAPATDATGGAAATPGGQAILTLDVDQKSYQQVVFARTHGELSLGLLPDGYKPDKGFPATTESNLFN